jgi:hypothetical protein
MSDVKMPGIGSLLTSLGDLKTPTPAPKPALPSILNGAIPVTQPKLDSKQNADPETMAQIQSMVWGNGNQSLPQAPPPAQKDIGQAPALNKDKGWGKI